MKKVLAFLLACVFVVSFAACGEKPADLSTDGEDMVPQPPVTGAADATDSSPVPSEDTTAAEGETTAAPTGETTTVPFAGTTTQPSTVKPAGGQTEAQPTQGTPTTAMPTTAKPTTAKPTTAKPTTAKPTTAQPVLEYFNDGNNAIEPNAVAVKPRHVYWQDEKLYAQCFVINGRDYNVQAIKVDKLFFQTDRGVIAIDEFGLLDMPATVLPPRTHFLCTFVFEGSAVKIPNAGLSSLYCEYSTQDLRA